MRVDIAHAVSVTYFVHPIFLIIFVSFSAMWRYCTRKDVMNAFSISHYCTPRFPYSLSFI